MIYKLPKSSQADAHHDLIGCARGSMHEHELYVLYNTAVLPRMYAFAHLAALLHAANFSRA